MARRRQSVIALLFGLARIELGARFLEQICSRLEERAEAAWSSLGGETQPPDVKAA